MVNRTLDRIARDLDEKKIDYAVIGAVALNQHGYKRFTEDVDLLLTKAGLARFHEELVGRGYRPALEGARRMFRTVAEDVSVDIVTTGEYPGDGLPKPVRFPDPKDVTVIEGIKTIALEKLVDLKLASGMNLPDRLKDLADVQELIKVRGLTADFAVRLDASVSAKFVELCDAVSRSRGLAADQRCDHDPDAG